MANKFILLVVLLTSFFSGTTFAQKTWTLEECIQHAIKNNLQIRQAENNLSIADQNLNQSRGAQLPTLNGTSNYNYNLGRNIDPFTNQFTQNAVRSNNFSLTSSLLLFNGLQVRNAISQSRYDYLALNYQVETLKNDISLNIAAAYLDILFNKELVENSTNQAALTRSQVERSKQLIEAGTLSPTAIYDLNSQLASEEAIVVRNKNLLALSYLNLAQYMDLPFNESFEVVQPVNIVLPMDAGLLNSPEEEIKEAIKQQPLIKNYEYRRLSTVEALQIARGRQSPRISLNGSLSTLYSSSSKQLVAGKFEPKPYSLQLRENYNRFLGISLSVPILNGLQVRTAINRAKLNADNAELDLKINTLTMEKSIRKANIDASASLSNFNAYAKAEKAAAEALTNATKRLDVGLVNSFEFNQTKTRLANAQSDAVRAKYDYLFKLKIVDFYKGVPLKL